MFKEIPLRKQFFAISNTITPFSFGHLAQSIHFLLISYLKLVPICRSFAMDFLSLTCEILDAPHILYCKDDWLKLFIYRFTMNTLGFRCLTNKWAHTIQTFLIIFKIIIFDTGHNIVNWVVTYFNSCEALLFI